jgi:hypothetical protein
VIKDGKSMLSLIQEDFFKLDRDFISEFLTRKNS